MPLVRVRPAVALLGPLLLACGAAPVAPASSAPSAPRPVAAPALVLPAHALLREDAVLHIRPDATSPWARITRNRIDVLARPHDVHVVKVLAVEADWILVETGAATACHTALLSGLAVRLYVHRDALVPVTTREVVVTDPDGTGVHLAAGTPMVGEGGPRVRVLRWIVAPPLTRDVHDAIGTVFQPSPALPDPQGDDDPFIGASVELEVFGDRVAPVRPGRDVLSVRVLAEGDPALIEVGDDCAGLRARVAADQVQPPGVVGGFAGGYGFGRRRAQHLRVGAELWWEDGTPAGRVIDSAEVAAPRAVGGRHCADVPLSLRRGVRDVTLCFRPEDAVAPEPER